MPNANTALHVYDIASVRPNHDVRINPVVFAFFELLFSLAMARICCFDLPQHLLRVTVTWHTIWNTWRSFRVGLPSLSRRPSNSGHQTPMAPFSALRCTDIKGFTGICERLRPPGSPPIRGRPWKPCSHLTTEEVPGRNPHLRGGSCCWKLRGQGSFF